MNEDILDKKKEFIRKLKEEDLEETQQKKDIVKFLQNIEKDLEKAGLLTDDLRKIIVSTRARLGLPEYIGAPREADKATELLKLDIISTIKTNGGVIKVLELKKRLAKRGWVFGSFSIETFLFQMAKKGELSVKKGYAWIGELKDSEISKRFLDFITKSKVAELEKICKRLDLEKEICEILVNELSEIGLITFDGKKVYSTTT